MVAPADPAATLNEISRDIQALHDELGTFEQTFVIQHIRQSLQSAKTGVDNELRNRKIDAEIAAKAALEGKKP